MFRVFGRHFSTSQKLYDAKIKLPMPVFGIEGRYVAALYRAASVSNELDKVEKSLRDFQKEISKPKIIDFIDTSMISRANKAKLLIEVGTAASMPNTAANFLGIVAENGRLRMLKRMIPMFLSVMVAHRNEALCELITATPLEQGARDELMAALQKFVQEGKKIRLTEKVDKSIIGGLIIGIEDKHIDMSIARKVKMYTDLLKQDF
ncbi:unnamed protein product [Arctia plantaginis]|uniref:Oligomycin sensitivity conferral protein n=1 Tax=Arctia plantaginis TaxID=874455 RepID=A0A8S1BAT1_ARCPL|nr:unnamed protein product [Arctia plantaginis]